MTSLGQRVYILAQYTLGLGLGYDYKEAHDLEIQLALGHLGA